ncbi:SIR2 family protein [Prosthecobacter sp.]|uniref:P-loop NTPase n=1 Tax=Prosthecobacter sp. TaxID=1965333 RepID=UPI002AB93929|nr:SIR2 family protein [Prosthecobacter sp.]MDZ4404746.1 SIR2 family protein [Prosthecobacter sp.]
MIKLLDKAALISIARYCDHPIAFLVGAPLSGDTGGGVPGVAPMLELVREEICKRAAPELPRYNAAMAGKSGGDAYQAAMEWLQGNVGQPAVNRVIEAAVLKSRKAGTDSNFAKNGKDCDWYIPAGTQQLAQLVCRDLSQPKPHFPGPILTTNFDPLLSLAIESCKARALWRVVQSDGKLADVRESGAVEVIHLHGFWRDSDTLHTSAQLTSERPDLRDSLRRILKQKTLIVAAYGGWDDVFARTLAKVAAEDDAQLNVIWCFRETDEAAVNLKYKELFERVAPAITRGRFLCYGGIDCHSIFGEIAGVAPSTPAAAAVITPPLAGWELIDSPYLAGLSPLRPEEVIRYFDGATPTWRHAISADIPRRAAVAEIARRFASARTVKDDGSLQLIRAAGGEGKTTLLLQAAADAVNSGSWNVLWRPTTRVGLPPEHVISLNPAKHWLIVADDAENLVKDFREAARLLHAAGHSHVHFLFAARDSDWLYFRCEQDARTASLKRHEDITLKILRPEDANVLVEAWRKCGADGLRELASLGTADEQVTALLHAVQGDAPERDEGSFFGGLLAVRFGPEGLRNHVVSLLTRLKEEKIQKSDRTLFDALVYVAACHAVGIPGLDEKVLADLVGVDRQWVQTLVVDLLGEEAAAVRSAGHVFTRHRKVAAAILVAAEQALGANIAEVWSAIVRQTVQTSRDGGVSRETHSKIIHAGPRLQRELPHQFSEQRRKEIAVAAARADIAAEPERLCALVDLGKTYRSAGDIEAAIRLFRENLPALPTKVDYQTDVRGYWYEWGGAEGRRGSEKLNALQSAWVCGLSLSDHIKAEITDERVKLSCAGTGVAFGNLAQARSDCPFALARRATAYLGLLANPDEKGRRFFMSDHRAADKINTPQPKTIEEAIGWLTTAVAQAGRELQDPFLKALLKPEQVSFNMLREFLNPAPPPCPRPKQHEHARRAAASIPVTSTANPQLHKAPSLDDRMREAVEKVAKKAWEAASSETTDEERLAKAKRVAGDLFNGLSPHVRRQVANYFTSQKWRPLIEREPKK